MTSYPKSSHFLFLFIEVSTLDACFLARPAVGRCWVRGEQTPAQALYPPVPLGLVGPRAAATLADPPRLSLRSPVEALLIVYFVFVFLSCYTASEVRPRRETCQEMI
jgi:hypothetical protein